MAPTAGSAAAEIFCSRQDRSSYASFVIIHIFIDQCENFLLSEFIIWKGGVLVLDDRYNSIGRLCRPASLRDGLSKGENLAVLPRSLIPLLMLLICLYSLFQSERVDASFIVSTLFLYIFATTIFGMRVDQAWASFPVHLKVLAVLCAVFVILGNAREFGSRQFGKIPARVGGGEPLKAVVLFDNNHQHLPVLLGIPNFNSKDSVPEQFASPITTVAHSPSAMTNLLGTNGSPASSNAAIHGASRAAATNPLSNAATLLNRGPFWGPVSILMRSEREIVFDIDLATTNRSHRAKVIRADQIEAIEFLNEPPR